MRSAWRQGACVLAAFVLVAVLQAWPLPRHLSTHLTGNPTGDAGIYVWNMWVFRHELTQGQSPFFTTTILSLGSRADLSLHNYTTFANVVALPLQPLVGLIAAFNVVYLLNVALAGFGMYLLAKRVTGRVAESWLAGVLFACSPFLVTRGAQHFSLVAVAPLPIFLWWLLRLWKDHRLRDAIGAGVALAWAAFSDPYYAVYCVMLAAIFISSRVMAVRTAELAAPELRHVTRLIDVALVAVASVTIAVQLAGVGRVRLGSLVISMRSLYTPVLLLTTLALVRLLLTWRPRVVVGQMPPVMPLLRSGAAAVVVAAILLAPVLYAVGRRVVEGRLAPVPVLWRSSAPGVDALSLVIPNPNHPLMPQALADWMATRPNGYHDEVASLSLVALVVLVVAWRRARWRPSRLWACLAAGGALLTLGPFIHIAGLNTYIPTPWAVLRYVPVIGSARMPSRLAIIAMLGLAVLFAAALAALADRYPHRRRQLLAIVGLVLAFELWPVPRTLFSAEIPAVYRTVAADPRPVRVLQLPFGIRDGLSSAGDFSAASQYYQTLHGKRLIGGYLSRVSSSRKADYRRAAVRGALMTLSERRPLTAEQDRRARAGARDFLRSSNLGYVVLETRRINPELKAFAISLFDLVKIQDAAGYELYVPTVSRER
jgi:hypothetical protein